MKLRFFVPSLLLSLLSGCATQQVHFQPWKGVPKEALADLQEGVFAVPKDKLLDAAAATLEHEPYLHWTFDRFDKANGLIIGSAGVLREVQLRVTDASSATEGAVKSRLAISVPRRVLKAQAKIYVLKSDASRLTAYEPSHQDLDLYNVLAADAELDDAYFYSFTYRVLNDRTQVPFSLRAYDDPEPLGQPPVQASTPAAVESAPAALSPAAAVAAAAPAESAASPSSPAAGALPEAHRE
jgi:hypothetical protein